MTTHADFEAASEGARWTGALAELFDTLAREALRAPERWVWRVLPHGAFVSMRATAGAEGIRREVKLVRSEYPADEKAMAGWRREVAVFVKHANAADATLRLTWQASEPARREPKGVVSVLTCLHPGEVAVGMVRCHRCEKVIKADLLYAKPTCETCAALLGREEAAANAERRQGERRSEREDRRSHVEPYGGHA